MKKLTDGLYQFNALFVSGWWERLLNVEFVVIKIISYDI